MIFTILFSLFFNGSPALVNSILPGLYGGDTSTIQAMNPEKSNVGSIIILDDTMLKPTNN